ncbi:hypothetical protein GPECTOR_197g343 [Gonium pectorale]|uniref:SRCR domain-containing protein n=1 Tax=Gonium pectorale TaxID=33097 RepID=A0A150FX11_GONPE|nr:hypothetical protein GPECTOR_197g343 [Gonium pectorale]|eukprot:KXZ42139.1 hypothetical protein GPECTOR_197g343 [Gonium pectorale]
MVQARSYGGDGYGHGYGNHADGGGHRYGHAYGHGGPNSAAAAAAAAAAVLSGVRCRGDEASLLDCARSGWGAVGGCASPGNYLAGVECSGGAQPPSDAPQSPLPPLPPPRLNQLPPTEAVVVALSPSLSAASPTTSSGTGLVKIRPSGAPVDDSSWSYVCGDPWAGWGAAAADTACRQAGFPAGGEPLITWLSDALPPVLLGKVTCTGYEQSLSDCNVTSVPGVVEAWQLAAPAAASAGLCTMLAGVRCRVSQAATAAVILRAAAATTSSAPPTSTSIFATANATANANANANAPVVVARLEASVGGRPFGAVCRDGRFDDGDAAVACRSLGYLAGGSVHVDGPARAGVTLDELGAAGAPVDAGGSYLGTVSRLRCRGDEAGLAGCRGWRSTGPADVVPCRAAAWVACNAA